MEITKQILIDHGVDPSLYNSDDLEVIEKYADKIQKGDLSTILDKITAKEPKESELIEKAHLARDRAIECVKQLSIQLDVIYDLCSSKQSIFSSSLSPEEVDRILVGAMNAFNKMFSIRDDVFLNLTEMFNYKQEIAEIRATYNKKLYSAGMLNAAFAVVCPEGDNESIIEASGYAFEKFNDLTEFNNDANDRIIIIDDALNGKLADCWNNIIDHLDFNGDGEKINTQMAKLEIEKAKQIIKDVVER